MKNILVSLMLMVFSGVALSSCRCGLLMKREDSVQVQKEQEPAVEQTIGDGSLLRIRKRGELVVGIAPQAPWAMFAEDGAVSGSAGEAGLIGFDVEIARRLAEDLGVKVRFVTLPQPSLLPDLIESRVDVVVSGYTITPERALFVSFSNSVADQEFYLIALKKIYKAGSEVSLYDKPEISVGTVYYTVAEAIAREKLPKASKVSLESYDDLLNKLLKGEVMAALLPGPIARAVARILPKDLTIVTANPLAFRPEAIALRRQDRELKDYLDSWVAFYRASGWIMERRNYWFNQFSWAKKLG